MSNPYGGPPYDGPDPTGEERGSPYQPYQPYEGPTQNPYGATGYSPGSPYGAASRPLDGVSLAGFVLSLVCCPPVGLVLGIVGLGRTKDDRRSGRWAAIAAVAIGALGTLAGIAFGAFVVWFGTNTVSVSTADAGQCVDVDGDTLWERECTEEHDAEIAYQGDFDRATLATFDEVPAEDFCRDLVSEGYARLLEGGDHSADVLTDALDEDDPDVGDEFVCLVEPADGSQLDERLVD